MDSELLYWIWLQSCLGVNNRRLKASMRLFGDARSMYEASERDFRLCGIFTDSEIGKLTEKSLYNCEKALQYCDKNGINIYHLQSEEYPSRLAEIFSPPIVLYAVGKLPDQNKLHCGIVGTRYPEDAYRSIGYNLAYDLAKHSCVIVSGGANGIDVCAHSGATDAGGITVCVLACGFDQYSSRNEFLIMERIPENGAVVTEYPPGIPPAVYNFPMRNRIITGLSHCNVVVQAGAGSGSLIAAKCSLAQNRKLFAVPGPMDSDRFVGSNILLKFGCSAVMTYRDILYWYQQSIMLPEKNGRANPEFDDSMKQQITEKFEQIPRHWNDDSRAMKPTLGYVVGTEIDTLCRELRQTEELTYPDYEGESYMEDEIGSGSADPSDPMARKGMLQAALAMKEQPEYSGLTLQKRMVIYLQKKFDISDESLNVRELQEQMCTEEYRDYLRLRRIYDILGWEYDSGELELNAPSPQPPAESQTTIIPVESEKMTADIEIVDKKQVEIQEKISENTANKSEGIKEQLTENASAVYDTILDEPVNVNIVKVRTGLPVPAILAALTELQLCGLVECLPGSRYIRS